MADSAKDTPVAAAPASAGSRGRTIAVVAGAIVLGLGIAFALATANKPEGSPEAFLAADRPGGPVTRIGPEAFAGSPVDEYLDARKGALEQASGDRLAVVSLDRYTTDREARASVGNSEVIKVIAAPPGGEPSTVERDLRAWADGVRQAAREERDGFKSQLTDVDDPATRRQWEADIERLNALIDRVSPTGPVVFAIVVRAPADRLREIGKSPGVRLVDVGSSDKLGEDPKFFGIRPEETKTLGAPDTRPL